MSSSPVEVIAYRCGTCSRFHPEREIAEKCCYCPKCGTPFEGGRKQHENKCGHCLYGDRLRDARKDVKRHKENWEQAEEHLTGLLEAGKPKKGCRQW